MHKTQDKTTKALIAISLSLILVAAADVLTARSTAMRAGHEIFDPRFHFPAVAIGCLIGVLVFQALAIWRGILRR